MESKAYELFCNKLNEILPILLHEKGLDIDAPSRTNEELVIYDECREKALKNRDVASSYNRWLSYNKLIKRIK